MFENELTYGQQAFPHFSLRNWGLKVVTWALLTFDWCMGWEPQEAWFSTLQDAQFPQASLGQELANLINASQKNLNQYSALVILICPQLNEESNDYEMQFILLGNGLLKKNILIISCLAWLFFSGERAKYKAAFDYGKGLNKFTRWEIQHLLREPLPVIKAMINNESVGESEAPIIW